jgi:hypothetical protein
MRAGSRTGMDEEKVKERGGDSTIPGLDGAAI